MNPCEFRPGLTPVQDKLLRFIEGQLDQGRVCPSYELMKQHMGGGTSKSTIHRLVVALEERGYINRLPGRVRAISIASPLANVPVYALMAELRSRGVPVRVDVQ